MNKGVSMLLVVLIIGSACLAMVVSSLWLGVGERQFSESYAGETKSRLAAEGCMENALQRLKTESNYGGESLSLGEESCIITIGRPPTPITEVVVSVVGTFGEYNKKITATVRVVDQDFEIISWQEN